MVRTLSYAVFGLMAAVPTAGGAQDVLSWSEAAGPAAETVSLTADCQGGTLGLRILNRNLQPSSLIESTLDGEPLSIEEASLGRFADFAKSSRSLYFAGSRCTEAREVTVWVRGMPLQPAAGEDDEFLRSFAIRY